MQSSSTITHRVGVNLSPPGGAAAATLTHLVGVTHHPGVVCTPARCAETNFPAGINLGRWPSPHSHHQCTLVAKALVIIPVVTAMVGPGDGGEEVGFISLTTPPIISDTLVTGMVGPGDGGEEVGDLADHEGEGEQGEGGHLALLQQ